MDYKEDLRRHTKGELLEIIESQQYFIHQFKSDLAIRISDEVLREKSKTLKAIRKRGVE